MLNPQLNSPTSGSSTPTTTEPLITPSSSASSSSSSSSSHMSTTISESTTATESNWHQRNVTGKTQVTPTKPETLTATQQNKLSSWFKAVNQGEDIIEESDEESSESDTEEKNSSTPPNKLPSDSSAQPIHLKQNLLPRPGIVLSSRVPFVESEYSSSSDDDDESTDYQNISIEADNESSPQKYNETKRTQQSELLAFISDYKFNPQAMIPLDPLSMETGTGLERSAFLGLLDQEHYAEKCNSVAEGKEYFYAKVWHGMSLENKEIKFQVNQFHQIEYHVLQTTEDGQSFLKPESPPLQVGEVLESKLTPIGFALFSGNKKMLQLLCEIFHADITRPCWVMYRLQVADEKHQLFSAVYPAQVALDLANENQQFETFEYLINRLKLIKSPDEAVRKRDEMMQSLCINTSQGANSYCNIELLDSKTFPVDITLLSNHQKRNNEAYLTLFSHLLALSFFINSPEGNLLSKQRLQQHPDLDPRHSYAEIFGQIRHILLSILPSNEYNNNCISMLILQYYAAELIDQMLQKPKPSALPRKAVSARTIAPSLPVLTHSSSSSSLVTHTSSQLTSNSFADLAETGSSSSVTSSSTSSSVITPYLALTITPPPPLPPAVIGTANLGQTQPTNQNQDSVVQQNFSQLQ